VLGGESGATGGGLNAGGDHVWKRAFIMNNDASVLDAEGVEDLAGLGLDRVTIIRSDARFESEFKTSAVARFDGDVEVGADFLAPVSGFGGMRNCG
jgi:hypothetical protein